MEAAAECEGVNEGVKINRREGIRLMIQAHPGLRIPDLAVCSGAVPEKTSGTAPSDN